ncbi:MAG: septum site-determining protein MinC [Bacillota bacterium]
MAGNQNVEIKGTRDGLVIFLNPTCDFDELKNALLRQLERACDFFKGARFTFHLGKKNLPVEQKQELVSIVARYGLVYTENIAYPTTNRTAKPTQAVREPQSTLPSKTQSSGSADLTTALPPGAGAAQLIRHSLRAGESIITDKHVVITGDVHPGTSVTSAGSIVVLGTLSGKAVAGAYGNKDSVVTALRFRPTALSIAGIAAGPPSKTLVNVKAFIKGGRVTIMPLRESHKNN